MVDKAPRPHADPALPDAPVILTEARYGPMRGAVLSGPAGYGPVVDRLRRKRWLYVGLHGQDFMAGAAIVNLGYAANAFVYVASFDGKDPVQWNTLALPLAAKVDRVVAQWRSGSNRIDLSLPTADTPGWMDVKVGPRGKRIEISAELTSTGGSPITSLGPARGRWTLTVKDTTLHAKGTWSAPGLGARVVDAPASYDVNDLYARRRTVWHWASFAGTDTQGVPVGLNLLRDNNEGPQDRENILWYKGEPLPLGIVEFDFVPRSQDQPWTIKGAGVDLRFDPAGSYCGDTNAGIVSSRFVQLFGKVSGTVETQGRIVHIKDVTGVAEDHAAKW